MKKNRILFRADGSNSAGYGHVVRALSLAAILKNKFHCVFIIQNPDAFLRNQVKNICDEIIEIPATENLAKEAESISKKLIKSDDIVVLDGYSFKTEYQTEIKKVCFKLVCIDDIFNTHFVADVIINHSEGIKISDYSKENYTKLFSGTKYAILRKSFLKKSFIQIDPDFSALSVFINMGGTDPDNYTKRALKICLKHANIKSIDIVIGSFYPYTEELKKMTSSDKKIKIHSNLTETKMYYLIKKSSIAICSASTISYECASVGGIIFIYKTAANQKNIYSFLIKRKVAFPISSINLKLTEFKNKKIRQKYFDNRRLLFSGNSDKNLKNIFTDLITFS